MVRVILPHPQDTSEFILDDEGTAGVRDDGEEGSTPATPSAGDEIGIGELLVTLRTVSDRVLINSPFPCKVLELNGEVEDNAILQMTMPMAMGGSSSLNLMNSTNISSLMQKSTSNT